MEAFVNRYATPLTIWLFAVSAISGSALFFHWLPGTFSRHTPQPTARRAAASHYGRATRLLYC